MASTIERAMSSQPPMGGHLDIPQKVILIQMYLLWAATALERPLFPSQGWLLIAGSAVTELLYSSISNTFPHLNF